MVQRSVNSDIAGIRMVSQAVAYVLRYAHWSRIRVRVPEIWLNCAVLLRRRHFLGVIGPVRLSIGIVSAIWSSGLPTRYFRLRDLRCFSPGPFPFSMNCHVRLESYLNGVVGPVDSRDVHIPLDMTLYLLEDAVHVDK